METDGDFHRRSVDSVRALIFSETDEDVHERAVDKLRALIFPETNEDVHRHAVESRVPQEPLFFLETDEDVHRRAVQSLRMPQVFSEQISSKAGPSKALEKQNLQESQQPDHPPNESWQQLMIMYLAKIERNTDQMVKLMTDGHGFGPHRSCKRRRDEQDEQDEQEKVRGNNEEAREPAIPAFTISGSLGDAAA